MKVCFVMPRAWHLVTERPGPHGGAELQTVRLARRLRESMEEVSFVTVDPGAATDEVVGGIRVIPALRESGGLPVVRTFENLRRLEKALDRSGADLFIQRAASPLTGLVARYARKRRKLSVFMLSNDSNLDGRYEAGAGFRDRLLYRRGLEEATGIVVQTENQASLLKRRFGRDAFLLPSAVPLPPEGTPASIPERVLWVGSYQRHKRPHLLLDLARRAPDLQFAVAGFRVADVAYGDAFESGARDLPNLTLLGRVANVDLDAHYLRAIALLSTSEYEGFPNTFLEAWRLGVPVVSLASDPDETICRLGLGYHGADPDRVIQELRSLRDDPARRVRIQEGAREYMKRHDEVRVAQDLAAWLLALAGGTPPADRRKGSRAG